MIRKYVLFSEQRARPVGAKAKVHSQTCPVYTTQDYEVLEGTLSNEMHPKDKGQGDVARRILSNTQRIDEHGVVKAYLRVWSCNRSEAINHLNKICPNPEYKEHG